jgi:DNA mismatch repair protein MutS
MIRSTKAISELRQKVAVNEAKIAETQQKIDSLVQSSNSTTFCGSHVITSTVRGKLLEKNGWRILFLKQHARINDDALNVTIATLTDLKSELNRACESFFSEFIDGMNEKYFETFADEIASSLGKFDMLQALAVVATLQNYCRPTIEEARDGSGITASTLRHPIIEKIVDMNGLPYVANDVQLSAEHSMLLYGANSVGKSSLLKAIACAVVMAQCGMFVAASRMTLRPYSTVAIHIGGRDDMYRSQSTFVREMEEVRSILRISETDGAHTLFLADELGNSTEDVSAVKIVSSILHTMYARRVTTLLATHMFSLQDSPLVVGLQGLRNYHLRIEFDDDHTILFDRTLKMGMPPTREYGCRIAERIITEDKDFVHYLKSDMHTKDARLANTSRCKYNRALFAEQCEICGYYPQTAKHLPLDWHHIEGQCEAVSGFVPSGRHVHARSNMMPVCKDCHRKIHKDLILVHRYEDTANGRRIRFECKHAPEHASNKQD